MLEMLSEWLSGDVVAAFLQVVMIDVVLAGDNAVVVGLAAAGLPKEQRAKVILIGILAATALRIAFALGTTWLLQIIGLMFAGGLLLLWVCWKMWRELRESHGSDGAETGADGAGLPRKTFAQAVTQIIVADVSMSLDNVLAVAGAAHEHPKVLIAGLVLSVGLMGAAASLIANLLNKHRWIAYVGLAIILYVACKMIYDGGMEVYVTTAGMAG
jgi:YjbE family integral membrane protein